VLLSVVDAVFRVLLDALVSRKHRDRELEILVLRHQLSVLQRTAGRPRLQVGDRFVLAAMAQWLPRSAWRSLLVSPDTVVRWHRQLVHRKWAAFGEEVAGQDSPRMSAEEIAPTYSVPSGRSPVRPTSARCYAFSAATTLEKTFKI
jgi:hypothetical protein